MDIQEIKKLVQKIENLNTEISDTTKTISLMNEKNSSFIITAYTYNEKRSATLNGDKKDSILRILENDLRTKKLEVEKIEKKLKEVVLGKDE